MWPSSRWRDRGRFRGREGEARIHQQGFTPLSISISHAQVAGGLTGEHRDPFDRMLIDQARE